MPERQLRPERIAHRGAPREFDENSLEGFLRAVERGAEAVELDVHRTRDGAVVVHHDPALLVPGGLARPIAELSLTEVARCVLPRRARVPTLAAVMDAVGVRATIYVELKGEGVGEAAVEVSQRHGGRYAFHGFDRAEVLRLQARWPHLSCGVLFDAGTPEPERLLGSYPVRDIWPHWSLVTQGLVDAAHAAGKRVLVWTVNDPELARTLTALGVDGLCTDDVRLLDPPGA